MKQAFDKPDTIVCSYSLYLDLLGQDKELKILKQVNQILFLECSDLDKARKYIQKSRGLDIFERFLDRFHLVYTSLSERKIISQTIYAAIANDYDEVVDKKRNKENIKNLFSLICQFSDPAPRDILDFGCGTGFSLDAIGSIKHILIYGFDIEKEMQLLAKKRGIHVVSEEDLLESSICFDAVFASYVFHLNCNPEYLAEALNCLKLNGVMAVNFHKKIGKDDFEKYVLSIGDQRLVKIFERDNLSHGQYVVYRKIEVEIG